MIACSSAAVCNDPAKMGLICTVVDDNGAPKTGVLKNGWITLWKITP